VAQVADPPTILPRRAWGALPPRRAARLGAVEIAIVHHTTGQSNYSRSDAAGLVREIQRLHMQSNGWDDIGYNLIVDRHGAVYEGRAGGPENAVVGAHTLGLNSRSTGIALLGEFSVAPVTEEAGDALARLLAWKLVQHHLEPGPSTIAAHCDFAATECPGAKLIEGLPLLRERVVSLSRA
jgi:hypothetical protein